MIMSTIPQAAPAADPTQGRGYFWAGIFVCLLGFALGAVQYYVLKKLIVPWYVAVLATLGVLLMALSVGRRRTIPRIVAFVLIAALAGFEWLFLGYFSKLPDYPGPARVGEKIPAFRT